MVGPVPREVRLPSLLDGSVQLYAVLHALDVTSNRGSERLDPADIGIVASPEEVRFTVGYPPQQTIEDGPSSRVSVEGSRARQRHERARDAGWTLVRRPIDGGWVVGQLGQEAELFGASGEPGDGSRFDLAPDELARGLPPPFEVGVEDDLSHGFWNRVQNMRSVVTSFGNGGAALCLNATHRVALPIGRPYRAARTMRRVSSL